MQTKTPLAPPPVDPGSRYWFARHSKSINFLVLILSIVGIYEALSHPDRRVSDNQLSSDHHRRG